MGESDRDSRSPQLLQRLLSGTTASALWLLTSAIVLVPFATGVWLAMNGHAEVAAMGAGVGLATPLVWSLLARGPADSIAGPARPSGDQETRPLSATVCGFVGACWQYGVLAAWTMVVFIHLVAPSSPEVESQVLLWGYGTIMAPIALMTGHRGNWTPLIVGLFIYVAGSIIHSFDLPLAMTATWLGAVAVAGALIDTAIGAAIGGEERRSAHGYHLIGEPDALGRELQIAMGLDRDDDAR
jgi:hypothetical protein